MNTEQQRKEFEEWALDKVTSLTIDEIDGEYFWVETQLAWEAWQAARKRQWMPIESAPKDGTQILSFAEWEGITVCSWLDCSEVWETTEKMGWAKNYDTVAMSYETFEPTYWMPLPNPPTNPNEL